MANWLTGSNFRSECRVEFDTNQCAEVNRRRVIDWNACIMRIWDGLAQTQIWIAYAQDI